MNTNSTGQQNVFRFALLLGANVQMFCYRKCVEFASVIVLLHLFICTTPITKTFWSTLKFCLHNILRPKLDNGLFCCQNSAKFSTAIFGIRTQKNRNICTHFGQKRPKLHQQSPVKSPRQLICFGARLYHLLLGCMTTPYPGWLPAISELPSNAFLCWHTQCLNHKNPQGWK